MVWGQGGVCGVVESRARPKYEMRGVKYRSRAEIMAATMNAPVAELGNSTRTRIVYSSFVSYFLVHEFLAGPSDRINRNGTSISSSRVISLVPLIGFATHGNSRHGGMQPQMTCDSLSNYLMWGEDRSESYRLGSNLSFKSRLKTRLSYRYSLSVSSS
jgi:hypothetical protein